MVLFWFNYVATAATENEEKLKMTATLLLPATSNTHASVTIEDACPDGQHSTFTGGAVHGVIGRSSGSTRRCS